MKEINLGDKTIRVRATPLALLYYRQEFKTDLIGDLLKLRVMEKDPSQFDSVVFLQIVWAMAKADTGPGNHFPGFESWLSELDCFDISDPNLLPSVMEEAADGFFRRAIPSEQQKRK